MVKYMIDFAPGMRTIIRDEEWMVKKIETNSLDNKTLYCVGVSPLVKDREAIFLADLEQVQVVDPAEVKLIPDSSPFYKRALLYLESQWRQQIPTDANLHIGHQAAMDLMPYQLDPAKLSLQLTDFVLNLVKKEDFGYRKISTITSVRGVVKPA